MGEILKISFISIIFSLVLSFPTFENFFTYLILSFFFFFLHYYAHLLTSKFFGLKIKFEVLPKFTSTSFFISLLFSLFKIPFKILIPGKIDIYAYKFRLRKKITFEEVGAISFAGPFINSLIAIFCWLFSFPLSDLILKTNWLIAISTLLPFGELDGTKILFWKKWLWFLFFSISILLLIT